MGVSPRAMLMALAPYASDYFATVWEHPSETMRCGGRELVAEMRRVSECCSLCQDTAVRVLVRRMIQRDRRPVRYLVTVPVALYAATLRNLVDPKRADPRSGAACVLMIEYAR